MNILHRPKYFIQIPSFLLSILFISMTLSFAEEPAKAATFSYDKAQAERIRKLQGLSLEDLHKVPIIENPPTKNIYAPKNTQQFSTACSSKNNRGNCK